MTKMFCVTSNNDLGIIFVIIFCFVGNIPGAFQQTKEEIRQIRLNHGPKSVADQNFSRISNELSNIKDVHRTLDTILIPRVPGTPGHEIVKQFIINRMQDVGWHVETDKFMDETPMFGSLEFENIITTLNPNAERYLTIACHYDSKFMKKMKFVGATDSAVPCAIMINLATILQKYFKQLKQSSLSLQFIFFDGEEAFVEWSDTDSIYGARHLAAKWEAEDFLKKIDVLILLDLLGTPDPKFYSYFIETDKWYNHLVDTETRLNSVGAMSQHSHSSAISKSSTNTYFQPYSLRARIEDDHIPFMNRAVPILHLIPTPFPDVWHQINDDRSALDFDTVANLNKIIGLFFIEYLHVEI